MKEKTLEDISTEKPQQKLELLGMLFGQKLYIDMNGCDPRVFDHAIRFWNDGIQTAEKLRKIKEILNK